jgi:hypothetical protein
MTGDNRVSQGSNPEDNGCGQEEGIAWPYLPPRE